jgi:hypothetical protein
MGDGTSECRYFDDLKSMARGKRIRTFDLGVSGKDKILSKCMNFVKEERIDLKHGDEMAIVTDNDGRYTPEEAEEFGLECDGLHIQLYLSNPSFEVWLLMHFQDFSKPCSQEELETMLSKVLGKKYSKSHGIPLDVSKVRLAISNAEKHLPSSKGPGDCIKLFPSTMVHRLAERLIE